MVESVKEMKLSGLVGLVFLSCLWLVSCIPTTPVWPSNFHVTVSVVDEVQILKPMIDLPLEATGTYFYNSSPPAVAYLLTDENSGEKRLEQIIMDQYIVTSLATGKCSVTPLATSVSSTPRISLFPPDFLQRGNATFVDFEYEIRDNVYFLLSKWTLAPTADLPYAIDYWHGVQGNRPFRMLFNDPQGVSSPKIIEFMSDFVATFADVPNLNFIFTQPSSCKFFKGTPKHHTPLSQSPRRVPRSAPAPIDWPLQFWTTAAFTGNEFGAQPILQITTIPLVLQGTYYYDYPNDREASVWTNIYTGHRSKTVIVNKQFHAVSLDTGSCVIPPVGIDGPMKYNWTQNFVYNSELWSLRGNSYFHGEKFVYDAFKAGFNNSFFYVMYDNGVPARFQGPILDFKPYGQSFSEYQNFVTGLDGIDVNTIFDVSKFNCKPAENVEDFNLNPTIKMHEAFSQMVMQKIRKS